MSINFATNESRMGAYRPSKRPEGSFVGFFIVAVEVILPERVKVCFIDLGEVTELRFC